MKNLVFSIVSVIALALPFQSSGQASLTLDPPTGNGWQGDTLLAGSQVTFPAIIRNQGNQPFFGTIALKIAVEDTGGTLVLAQTDSIVVPQNNMLNPGDTVVWVVTHVIDMQRYVVDGNTTVIWPEAPGLTGDSIFGTVWVIDPNRIIEHTDDITEVPIRFYPNPTQDFINIELPALYEGEVEQVRIVSMTGQVVRTYNKAGRIWLGEMPSGVYFLQVAFRNNSVQTYKIIKQP